MHSDFVEAAALLREAEATHGSAAIARLRRALRYAAAGTRPPAHSLQNPVFVFPDLGAKPWYDAADFPFVAGLEAQTDIIAAEAAAAFSDGHGFQPYRHDHSSLDPDGHWTALFFRIGEEWIEENCARCPETARIVRQIPRACENAMFSALRPGGHIAAHCGTWNCRILIHLGLEIPDGCRLRVGEEARHWQRGRCLVFDDSFEHEAWNDSAERRIVLLVDVWHPDLTDIEVALLEQVRTTLGVHSGREMASRMRGHLRGTVPARQV